MIDWNVYGKVKRVDFANKADLWFGYDAMGRRNVKRVTDQANNTQKAEIYALDAQGNVMAVYEINKDGAQYALSCKEFMLYGSSRLGISKKKITFKNKSAIDMSPPPCQMITKKQLVILDFSVSVKILMA